MLFDEKDLNVFELSESRTYFKEILQSYYSQNYRATIVMLYSFVIYDLFLKLQNMANEGDEKAEKALIDINQKISDDEKYSVVENSVIQFFKDNSPLYFNRFVEDVEYLKNCRNKCAHLKVNDNTLYVPSDYHARMLICSMYDNIFSVKAPLIMDLFSHVENDVENYSLSYTYIPSDGLDEATLKTITTKYLQRMTFESLKKSYKTFLKLLFISDDTNCINNIGGLYVFSYALTDYISKNYITIFEQDDVISVLNRIEVETIESNSLRKNALISIMVKFPKILDKIRVNETIFDYIAENVLLTVNGLEYYRLFYPRTKKSIYEFFKENNKIHIPYYTERLYKILKDCNDFNVDEYMELMVSSIPYYNGFDSADNFMDSLKTHKTEISSESLKKIMSVYSFNSQCTQRARHTRDKNEINDYLETLKSESENISDTDTDD